MKYVSVIDKVLTSPVEEWLNLELIRQSDYHGSIWNKNMNDFYKVNSLISIEKIKKILLFSYGLGFWNAYINKADSQIRKMN